MWKLHDFSITQILREINCNWQKNPHCELKRQDFCKRKRLIFFTLKKLPTLISFLTFQNSMCAPLCYATTVIVIFDLLWTISFMILFKSPRQMHISFHCSRKHFLPKHKIRGNFLHFCLTPSNGTSPVVRPSNIYFISSTMSDTQFLQNTFWVIVIPFGKI